MSERVIAHGSNFMCFLNTGTEETPVLKAIAGQKACTYNNEANYRETNNKNLAGWKDYFGGLKGWSATVEMDIPDYNDTNTSEISFEELQTMEENFTKGHFYFCWVQNESDTDQNPTPDFTKPYYHGLALVNCPLNANPGENATTSITLQGCRKPTRVLPT